MRCLWQNRKSKKTHDQSFCNNSHRCIIFYSLYFYFYSYLTCIVMYCTVLHCTVLYCTVQRSFRGALVWEIHFSVFHMLATWLEESAAVIIHGSGNGSWMRSDLFGRHDFRFHVGQKSLCAFNCHSHCHEWPLQQTPLLKWPAYETRWSESPRPRLPEQISVLYCTVLYCTVLSLRTRQTSITVYDFEQQNKGITMTCTSNRVAHHIASVHTNNYYSVQKPHLYWYELRSNIYNRSIIESLIMHSGSHILLLNLLILPL